MLTLTRSSSSSSPFLMSAGYFDLTRHHAYSNWVLLVGFPSLRISSV